MTEPKLDLYFEESAAKHPYRPALNVDGRSWSYAEVQTAKRKVAALLREVGLGSRGCTVGICCAKSFAAYAGLLGTLESGNIYVPLNPKFPCERLLRIVDEADLTAVIVDRASTATATELLQRTRRRLVVFLPDVSTIPGSLARLTNHRLFATDASYSGCTETLAGRSDQQYAYLLFTSGSTGVPKGVPVTHANACACIEAMSAEFGMTCCDRFTHFSELSFDLSIGEIFLCWKEGGCLYVPSFAELMMPIEFVNRHRLTVWCSVPTTVNNLKALGSLKPGCFPWLRLSLFCGEALPCKLAEAWQAAAPSSVLVNLYGPTEATVFSTFYLYDRSSPPTGDTVPLGKLLRGFKHRIMGEPSESAPACQGSGELLLSGPQVVTGYWRSPEMTEKAFVRLPDDTEGNVWYRTGDLVSFDKRHGLLFCGRCDDQIKTRGYRVQLREIESVLRWITGSDLVAVVPVYTSDGFCDELIAYCNNLESGEGEVKRQCRTYLPDYMLPRRIVSLSSFPLNNNGKVDYPQLATRAKQLILSSESRER